MIKQSYFFRREPSWFNDWPGLRRSVPLPPRSWLYESGSLTLRLQRATGTGFAVVLVGQDWGQPFIGESRLLGMTAGTTCLVREVALMCGDVPLVLARSIIPATTLRGAEAGLARLGTRPLGEVLFACPRLQRTHMQLARLKPGEFRQMPPEKAIWGRRSLYRIAAGDLLVCEFFLPAVFDLPEAEYV